MNDLIKQFDTTSHLILRTDKVVSILNKVIPYEGALLDLIWVVQCYEELVEKFSGSASLRRDYAEFCDIIINDFDKAELHRHGAELLESGC